MDEEQGQDEGQQDVNEAQSSGAEEQIEDQDQENSQEKPEGEDDKEKNFKKLREKVKKQEEKIKTLSGAEALHNLIVENPEMRDLIAGYLRGEISLKQFKKIAETEVEKPKEEDYEDYEDPIVREKFKMLDDLVKWKADKEARDKERETQQLTIQIEKNMNVLEDEFSALLKNDGLGDISDNLYSTIRNDIITRALTTHGNIFELTKDEFKQVYRETLEALKDHERITRRKSVTSPTVHHNDKNSTPSTGKGLMEREDRIAQLVKFL